MINVNLGCGKHKMVGFVNVDVDTNCLPDITDDATHYLSTLTDGSVGTVVMNHLIQCLNYDQLHNLFLEIVRVVAPSSLLYITIPDIKKAIRGFELGLIEPAHLDMVFLGQRYNEHTISWTIWTEARLKDTMSMYNLVAIQSHSKHVYLYRQPNWQTCVEFRYEPNKEKREKILHDEFISKKLK